MEQKIINFCNLKKDPDGFQKIFINKEIGYGIFVTRNFARGEILLEYKGQLSLKAVPTYSKEERCFIFYFHHNGKFMSIDATEGENLAKFVNDSPVQYRNCSMRLFSYQDMPRLFLIAEKRITAGTELRYDYNDKKNILWRAVPNYWKPLSIADVHEWHDRCKSRQKPLSANQVLKEVTNAIKNSSNNSPIKPHYVDEPTIGYIVDDKNNPTVIPTTPKKSSGKSYCKTNVQYFEKKGLVCNGNDNHQNQTDDMSNDIDFEKVITNHGHDRIKIFDKDGLANKGKEYQLNHDEIKEAKNINENQLNHDGIDGAKKGNENHPSHDEINAYENSNENQLNHDDIDGAKKGNENHPSHDEINAYENRKENQLNHDEIKGAKNSNENQLNHDDIDGAKKGNENHPSHDEINAYENSNENQLNHDDIDGAKKGNENHPSHDEINGGENRKENQLNHDEVNGVKKGNENHPSHDEINRGENGKENQLNHDEIKGAKNGNENQLNHDDIDGGEKGNENYPSHDEINGGENRKENQLNHDEIKGAKNGNENQLNHDEMNGGEKGNENHPSHDEVNAYENSNENQLSHDEINACEKGNHYQLSQDDINTSEKGNHLQLRQGANLHSKKETKDPYKKVAHKCPEPDCLSSVKDLPKHMRDVHKWPKDKAKHVLNMYGLRKTYTKRISSSRTTKQYVRKLKMCPIENCFSVTKKVDVHLKSYHKMHETAEYYKLLKRAKLYTPPSNGDQVKNSFSTEASAHISNDAPRFSNVAGQSKESYPEYRQNTIPLCQKADQHQC